MSSLIGTVKSIIGTVKSIEAIWCRYEHRDREVYPVSGTTTAVRRDEATGWEPEDDDVHFVGYVVTLETE